MPIRLSLSSYSHSQSVSCARIGIFIQPISPSSYLLLSLWSLLLPFLRLYTSSWALHPNVKNDKISDMVSVHVSCMSSMHE